MRQPDRTTVLLANLTAGTCEVRVCCPAAAAAAHATLRILDEHSAERAAADLPSLPAHRPAGHHVPEGTVLLTLNPYGTARLEVSRWLTGGAPWLQARDRVQDMYGHHAGTPADTLPTPALIVDLGLLSGNIAAMMAALDGQSARLRPHTKVQKSPDIALLQVEAGAIGVTVATIWEAAAMAAAGVGSILVANEVIGPDKIAAAAALARHADLVDRRRRRAQHRRPVGGDDGRGQPGRHPRRPRRRHGPLRRALARAGPRASPGRRTPRRDSNCAASRPMKVTACSSRTATTRVRLATEAMAYAASVKELLRGRRPARRGPVGRRHRHL